MTCSSGKAETTRSLAKVATISCSVATATMCSPAARGDDQVFGEAGNDRMIWNPGDGSDLLRRR